MSKKWCVLLAALLVALSPLRASAAVVTVSIGTFEWSQFFFSDDFSLENISSSAGIAGDFGDISLLLTADEDLDGNPDAPFDAFAPPAFSPTLGSSAPNNSLFTSVDTPILSASLFFRFTPVGLPQLEFAQTFAAPDVIFIEYSYEVPEPEPSPVPEPSSLILLTAGLGATLYSRANSRRRRQTHSVQLLR